MKKLLSLALTLCLMALPLICGAETTQTFPGPWLITSAGQSADAEMVKVMMTKLGITDFTVGALATPDSLEGIGTLIVTVGGSSKGLGAAGIDADTELERVTGLIDAAIEAGIPVLSLHIGGSSRRGDLSDKFIEPCISRSNSVIVVAEGNTDGLFDTLCEASGVPLITVDKIASAMQPLGELLAQ